MRSLVVIAALAGTAAAGPVLRIGSVGGTDTSAPGGRDDGITAGAGFRSGIFTAEVDYTYLSYDGTTGVGGDSHRVGGLLQAAVLQQHCHNGESYCPHVDIEAGMGRRWIEWQIERSGFEFNNLPGSTIDRTGTATTFGQPRRFRGGRSNLTENFLGSITKSIFFVFVVDRVPFGAPPFSPLRCSQN